MGDVKTFDAASTAFQNSSTFNSDFVVRGGEKLDCDKKSICHPELVTGREMVLKIVVKKRSVKK